MTKKNKQYNYLLRDIPPDLQRRLRNIASASDKKLQEIFLEAITEYAENIENIEKKQIEVCLKNSRFWYPDRSN